MPNRTPVSNKRSLPAPAPTVRPINAHNHLLAPPSISEPKTVSPEKRQAKIRLHAYLIAEKDGFAADPSYYWQLAEREVDSTP